MDFALFNMTGLEFLFRFGHFLAGVIWIGMLWYFNFVQGSFFKESTGDTKKEVTQKLVPNALWWFRWGAMFTFITGVLLLLMKVHVSKSFGVFNTSWGVTIMTGALMGTFMFLNVWLIIWPAQKIVIGAANGENLGDAAAAGARAGLASRTNTLFSLPLLFMMGAASHLPISIASETSVMKAMAATGAVILLLEINGIKGKLGPMASVSGVIHCGIWLTVVLYGLIEIIC